MLVQQRSHSAASWDRMKHVGGANGGGPERGVNGGVSTALAVETCRCAAPAHRPARATHLRMHRAEWRRDRQLRGVDVYQRCGPVWAKLFRTTFRSATSMTPL